MITAIVVAVPDRQWEALLKGAGVQPRFLSEDAVLSSARGVAPPDLYVIDLRGRTSIPSWLAALRRQQAAPAILVILSSLESGMILEAMRAGVNECLGEPLTAPDLQSAVTRLTSKRAASVGAVFAFLGAKGGVGTTTAVVNVATALRELPASSLVIDLHLTHGDAAVFLGAEARFSVIDALENIQRLDATAFDALVTKTKGGPDLLASSDRSLVGSTSAPNIRALIEFAASRYRYVVLDVPRSDPNALDALDQAAHIVVVGNQELATVRSAARILEALRVRYGQEHISVIISRFDAKAEIRERDVERVTRTHVRATVPSDYRLALQSLNSGRPLMIDNHSGLAGSYRELAHNLAGVGAAKDAGTGTSTLFGRLLGRKS